MTYAASQPIDRELRDLLERAFIRLFLWYSIALSPRPGPSWVRALRIMRQYRDEARRFAIRRDPLPLFEGRARSRAVMRLLWALSSGLPSQEGYFEAQRARAWGRPILWVPPLSREAVRSLQTEAGEESSREGPANP